jgi:hypothetical protein
MKQKRKSIEEIIRILRQVDGGAESPQWLPGLADFWAHTAAQPDPIPPLCS